MDKYSIINSPEQYSFSYTTDLDDVVANMLLPYEGYFTKMFSIDKEKVARDVKEIIMSEVENISDREIIRHVFPETEAYSITIGNLVRWQKEMFQPHSLLNSRYMPGYLISKEEVISSVFPVSTENISALIDINVSDETINSIVYQSLLKNILTTFEREKVKLELTYWYSLYSHLKPFENFNSLLGNIVINILSYSLTNKYLIK